MTIERDIVAGRKVKLRVIKPSLGADEVMSVKLIPFAKRLVGITLPALSMGFCGRLMPTTVLGW